MQGDRFRYYLKRKGKKPHVVENLVVLAERSEKNAGKKLEDFEIIDLENCLASVEIDQQGMGKKVARSLALYFAMNDQQELSKAASTFREAEVAKTRTAFALKNFRGVKVEDAAALETVGISSTTQLLDRAITKSDREALSAETGLPYTIILDFVKLADLSRIPSIKQVRARLYVEMGVDTVEKMAAFSSEELVRMACEHIVNTGFEGIATLPAEAEFSVKKASVLPKVIKYAAGE